MLFRSLNTLNRCELCLGINLLSMGITMGEGRRRDYTNFSLKMRNERAIEREIERNEGQIARGSINRPSVNLNR